MKSEDENVINNHRGSLEQTPPQIMLILDKVGWTVTLFNRKYMPKRETNLLFHLNTSKAC